MVLHRVVCCIWSDLGDDLVSLIKEVNEDDHDRDTIIRCNTSSKDEGS